MYMKAPIKLKLEIEARQKAQEVFNNYDEGLDAMIYFAEELNKAVSDFKSTAVELAKKRIEELS